MSTPLLVTISQLPPLDLPVEQTDRVIFGRGGVAYKASPAQMFRLTDSFTIFSGDTLDIEAFTQVNILAPVLNLSGTSFALGATTTGAIVTVGNLLFSSGGALTMTVSGTINLDGALVATAAVVQAGQCAHRLDQRPRQPGGGAAGVEPVRQLLL